MTFQEWWESEEAPPVMYKEPCKLAWDIATKEERERCAKLVENFDAPDGYDFLTSSSVCDRLAKLIRQGESK